MGVCEHYMNTMPPEDREDIVLHYLYSIGIPLPPIVIYRGLKINRNITFSYRTVQNIASRLTDEGLMMRCDKTAMDKGRIEPLPSDSDSERTYYYPTQAAMDRIKAYDSSA